MERNARPHVVVVMPAYNAAKTVERTYRDIPRDVVERVILVDDVSSDDTVDIARRLGIDVVLHARNRGYGANQKTCYARALADRPDVVVMVHPDYQYDPTCIPAVIAPMLEVVSLSKTGSQVTPPFWLLKTPPVAAPA